MACNSTFTTNSILYGLGIYETSCSKKIEFMNRALRVFYSRISDLYAAQYMESFSIPGGDHNNTLTYPVYKVWGFYGRGSGKAFEDNFDNIEYNCEGCKVKRIRFSRGGHFLDDWQYKLDSACDDKIYIRTPCEITNGYILYSRGPAVVTSVDGTIPMSNYLRTGFEMLLQEMRSSTVGELNNTSYRNSQFEKRLEELRETQAVAAEFITHG